MSAFGRVVSKSRIVHLKRRNKSKKKKRKKRDRKKVSAGIAHFGKALMQSRLGSARRSARRIQRLFSSSSSSSSSPHTVRLTEADAFRARHRDCRPAPVLVSSPLIYYRGIPNEPDKRIDGPTSVPRLPPGALSLLLDIWHVRIQIRLYRSRDRAVSLLSRHWLN